MAEALDADTALVSVMLVNNETGAVQRVAEIAAAVRDRAARIGRRILLHTDAVQAFGKIPFSPASARRRRRLDQRSQDRRAAGNRRTVSAEGARPRFLAAAAARRKACGRARRTCPGSAPWRAPRWTGIARLTEDTAAARRKAERLVAGVRRSPAAGSSPRGGRGETDPRYSPWIVSVGFPPFPGEVVVRLAERRGFCVATGSACSSRKKDRTRVLEAMGCRRKTALCAVRVSTGPSTTEADIDGLLDALAREIPPARALARGSGR